MEFFNKKEEVIDLQLTQYGRHLLSRGQFKPEFYCFFDDNILYDVGRANLTEEQNESEDRIRVTPTIHPQIGFSSLEREFKNSYGMILSGKAEATDESMQRTAEKHYLLPQPLGTSDVNSEHSPSWSVRFLNGSLTGSVNYLNLVEKSGGRNTINVPQLKSHTELEYIDISSGGQFEYDESLDGPLTSNLAITTEKENTYIVLKIMENNGLIQKKNFDIEFFEVLEEETSTGEILESLRPLSFSRNYDPEDAFDFINEVTPEDDEGYVDYYFDFRVDDEINQEILCNLDQTNTKMGVHADSRVENCQEILNQKKRALGNIYIKQGDESVAGAIDEPGNSEYPGEVC